jgi:hypothetical protein
VSSSWREGPPQALVVAGVELPLGHLVGVRYPILSSDGFGTCSRFGFGHIPCCRPRSVDHGVAELFDGFEQGSIAFLSRGTGLVPHSSRAWSMSDPVMPRAGSGLKIWFVNFLSVDMSSSHHWMSARARFMLPAKSSPLRLVQCAGLSQQLYCSHLGKGAQTTAWHSPATFIKVNSRAKSSRNNCFFTYRSSPSTWYFLSGYFLARTFH